MTRSWLNFYEKKGNVGTMGGPFRKLFESKQFAGSNTCNVGVGSVSKYQWLGKGCEVGVGRGANRHTYAPRRRIRITVNDLFPHNNS